MTTNRPTYADYLTYCANLKGAPVKPFSQKEWDNMPAANMFGLSLLIRQQQARLAAK